MRNVPNINAAQQAGCVGDFMGDGAPGLVLALNGGTVWYFPRKMEEGERALGLTVALAPGSGQTGPVTVWVSETHRGYGAMVVRAGEPGAFYGTRDAKEVTLQWRWPGGKVLEKQVVLVEKPTRVVIDGVGGKVVEGK